MSIVSVGDVNVVTVVVVRKELGVVSSVGGLVIRTVDDVWKTVVTVIK